MAYIVSALGHPKSTWVGDPEYIQALEDRQEPQWWVLVETDAGVRGWANRPEHFGNKDACG